MNMKYGLNFKFDIFQENTYRKLSIKTIKTSYCHIIKQKICKTSLVRVWSELPNKKLSMDHFARHHPHHHRQTAVTEPQAQPRPVHWIVLGIRLGVQIGSPGCAGSVWWGNALVNLGIMNQWRKHITAKSYQPKKYYNANFCGSRVIVFLH